VKIPDPIKGDPGKDAEEVDIEALAAKVLASVKIPDPIPGKNADPLDAEAVVQAVLSKIPPPQKGKDADQVDYLQVSKTIADMVAQAVKAIPKPRDGDPGTPGRDALEIVPQSGINEAMSYPLGTWATHNGGLFRAYRTTDPVEDGDFKAAGWECIVRGVKDDRMALANDSRTQIRTVELSDGSCITSKVKHPAMLFRGVYGQGITYERGDVVSWGGNAWHAKASTTEKPGDDSKDWEIAARRGRDGNGKDMGAR
jgi:hypothetical protein